MNKFLKIISGEKGTLNILPLLHSCEAYDFNSILQSKELIPSDCNVFTGSKYLYTFYGIPSYRSNKTIPTSNPSFFPVCFILDYANTPLLKKLYPFDTGAFVKLDEIKKKHFHEKMRLEDFELNSDIMDAIKLIEKFYRSNENYVKNRVQFLIEDIDITNFEAYSYTSMITDKSSDIFDNRISTIEAIFDEKIILNKHSLRNIILPSAFSDDPDIKNCLKNDFNITSPITYETIRGQPREYFGAIYSSYVKYLKENSLF